MLCSDTYIMSESRQTTCIRRKEHVEARCVSGMAPKKQEEPLSPAVLLAGEEHSASGLSERAGKS